MWCFLGKFAKRKSLKPDLFRRAVSKAQDTPRKSKGSSPVKSLRDCVRVEVQPIEDREPTEERVHTPSRSAFEIIEEEPSRSAFESEVREDVLQARAGPSEEDVQEALKSVSPVSADEAHEDRDSEDLKDDDGPSRIQNDGLDENGGQMPETTDEPEQQPAIGDTTDDVEADEDDNKVELRQHAMAVEVPAIETRYAEVNTTEKDDKEDPVEDETLQAETPNSSEGNADAGHTAAEVSLSHEVLPAPCDTSSCEHDQASTMIEERSPLPSNESPVKSAVESETPLPEAQKHPALELAGEDQDAETMTKDFDIIQGEDLEVGGTTDEASQPPLSTDDVESDDQTKTGESLHDAMSPKDDFAILLVDSVPNLQTDELSASPQRQSPRPVVKLPSCTNASTQNGQAEMDHVLGSEDAPTQLPTRMTRSGARFSDDTNLLKDFLSRAQARKLARDSKIPAMGATGTSPRRSPRKVLAEKDSNSPSPQKPNDLASRPGTPPGKQRLDAFTLDDVDELTAEPTSCRRSNRTRLPSTPKVLPGAPSFIPVRRADGTDPVVLPKSIAQDLAIQTRANTRRNKGQAKPPSVALQTLTIETTESVANRVRARATRKSVGWDEKLVYYQGVKEVAAAAEEEGREEKRPKVKRLRGLGATNGTPAPKRVVDNNISQGTPAPRRRGKV